MFVRDRFFGSCHTMLYGEAPSRGPLSKGNGYTQ